MNEPNTFRDRASDVKRLEDGVKFDHIKDTLAQVANFLLQKATYENRKQDRHNQTYLGGVSFYLEYNDITKEIRLNFDKDPRTWNQRAIIEDMLALESSLIMEKQANQDIIDNPFRY